MNYYNEIDPFAAAWLRELIKADHISAGEVDERSIEDVRPNDLRGFKQCHFFAGIGVWSHALRAAGWPDDREVWTGSSPCQPFSSAGKGAGATDERHLWPAWFHLIEQCHPPVVFGEQVEAAIRHGWLDTVQTDLEGSGYTFGATGLPAAGFGAPHIRARLFFVADANGGHPGAEREQRGGEQRLLASCGGTDKLGDPNDPRPQGRLVGGHGSDQLPAGSASMAGGFWDRADWLYCRDNKYRPVEPGTFPLAHGATNRVGRLRGYGNAIVAPVAQAFITSYLDATK